MENLKMKAHEILEKAISTIKQRGVERDSELTGERSMAKIVDGFNAITGHGLTVKEGWLFMVLLKATRAASEKPQVDDFVDGAAYFGLAGEDKNV